MDSNIVVTITASAVKFEESMRKLNAILAKTGDSFRQFNRAFAKRNRRPRTTLARVAVKPSQRGRRARW